MRKTIGVPLPRTGSVSQDWRLPLSPDKTIPYMHTLRLLETSYTIFSINLDEAIGLRRGGQLNKSYLALSITPSLCGRLSGNLQVLLRAMLAHAKHFRTIASSSPLDPENFQLAASRRAANFGNLCGRVILSRRSQFMHKLSTLQELVEDLEKVFLEAVSELQEGCSTAPEQEWATLDSSHYDMNTCVREAIVVLKCFLHALPEEQLPEFTLALQKQRMPALSPVFTPKRHLAHRRMTLLKGQ